MIPTLRKAFHDACRRVVFGPRKKRRSARELEQIKAETTARLKRALAADKIEAVNAELEAYRAVSRAVRPNYAEGRVL